MVTPAFEDYFVLKERQGRVRFSYPHPAYPGAAILSVNDGVRSRICENVGLNGPWSRADPTHDRGLLFDPLPMTPEKKARLRELPRLIANENDFDKMKTLALELQRLIDEDAAERDLGRLAD